MALKVKQPEPKRDRPSLSSSDVEAYSGGAITYDFLKRDRAESAANGISPLIPFYRLGHRSVLYRPGDIDAYLESCLVK